MPDGRLASGDAADQGSAAAYRAVPDAPQRARGRASAFDAFGRALDAAGDRPARGAAADDGVLPDEVRLDRAGALLSARRSSGCRCDQGPGRKIRHRCCLPITAPWCRANRWKRRCLPSRSWKRPQNSICCCGAEPALPDAGADRRFVKNVRVDVAGAQAPAASLRRDAYPRARFKSPPAACSSDPSPASIPARA